MTPTDAPTDPADRAGHATPSDAGRARTVVAAGGVVIDARPAAPGAGPSVLVVHRPAYDDWSLPKGHVDPGEDVEAAALREVAEETGVRATVVSAAGTTEHTVRAARGRGAQVVHWFVMRPASDDDPDDDPTLRPVDDEVDRAEWWPVPHALDALTHAGERALLRRVTAAP
jgi:ADP-ribose pyrophosphatase YjhB (NUDIX family)